MTTKYDVGQTVYRPDGCDINVIAIRIEKGLDKVLITYFMDDAQKYEEEDLHGDFYEYMEYHRKNFKGRKPPTEQP